MYVANSKPKLFYFLFIVLTESIAYQYKQNKGGRAHKVYYMHIYIYTP